MTTLAADKVRHYLDQPADHEDFPVIASDIIYEGAAVGMQVTSGTAARPLVATDRFLGFAVRKADNSAGAAGAINVRVRRKGAVEIPVTGADNTKVGSAVYASDDDTFTLTSTSNSKIGFVRRHISSTTCLVEFDATLANYA